MPALKVSGLNFSYGAGPLIKDLSFELRPGDFMCVLGPNGSGKSTLLKLLTGFIKAASGSVKLGGEEAGSIKPERLARLAAYVASETSTPYDFSARETVLLGRTARAGFWRGYSSEDGAAAALALEETGITALADRSINTLSTGERQLVFIAQALAQEAKLLLLDEPTSHLDIGHEAQIMDLLKRLNRDKSLTIVMVLHDLNLASEYCSRIILLDRGGVFQDGTAEEILTYQNIESVYKTTVIVNKNPLTGKPFVVLVSQEK